MSTAAPNPIDRIRLLTAAATAAPRITPGIRPTTASVALRRSTSPKLRTATDVDSGSTATSTAPGMKSVSMSARNGADSSPNPSPMAPCTAAPTTAMPTQTRANSSDTSTVSRGQGD